MPLEALMKQQHQRLLSSAFNAVIVMSTDDAHSVLQKEAMVPHMFMSPEVFCDFFVPAAIESADTTLFSHVFVDESHCVVNWGLSDKRTTAFRGKFALIGRIRSVMPEAAMAAMTATVAVEKQIGGVDKCFEWLSKELSSGTCPKTLVFVRMLDHAGKIFRHLEAEVPEGNNAMFHSRISEQGKADITAKFCSTEDSMLKCVVCTSAFSMGMDIADIRRIVHYGAPSSLD
ncbi:probable ATP-dependent DNA helicase RecS [Watersipora subatra]|uniref:probable ATP-dependent DNA helicase RecS n=1 Tax=Watersipora subatra TaxID=2589382 RepID=UPI00355AD5F7